MVKIATIFILALCFLGLSYGLYPHVLLSNWSISTVRIPYDGGGRLLPAEFLKTQKYMYSLSREHDERVVAIVEGKKDGSVILNPRHVFGLMRYNYGPIPETSELTKNQANSLYGKPVETIDFSSYRLCTSFPKNSQKVIFLDLRFQNNKLHEFRIRSSELESTDWISVQKEVEGA